MTACVRPGPARLSFAQEGLWRLEALTPNRGAYNVYGAWALRGPVDAAALGAAFEDVVGRHDILRARVDVRDGVPWQIVDPSLQPCLASVDLSRLPHDEAERQAQRRTAAEESWPFDLERGPLVRLTLLSLGAGAPHILVLTQHHMITDDWSIGVMARELSAAYSARVAGAQPPSGGRPLQYAEFAAWQRAAVEDGLLAPQLAYWRGRLAGAPGPLVLARGRHGADDRTLEAGVERDLVPSALLHRLDDVAERHGITLYTALLAAFGMVLATVSGRLDLVVATPLSNRTLRGTPGMLGPAMNVVPLRLMLGGCHAIADVLAQARQVVLGAFEHHDAPYESVPPEPGAGVGGHPASPLRVLFNYFGHKAAGLQFAAVAAQRLPRDSRSSRFDLTLAARRADQALHLSVVYRQALFERDRVRALLAAYRATLARIAEDPKAPWLV